jgi:predicted lipopolysaccharide heptosyltransferase III
LNSPRDESLVNLDKTKLLIIKLAYIGDTISIIPVIENLKEKAPGVTLDVMVNRGSEELLKHHPSIRKVYAYDRKTAKKNLRSSLLYNAKLFRALRSERYSTVIDYTLGDRSSFISFLTGAGSRISYENSSRLSHLLMNHFIDLDPFDYHIVDYQLQALRLFGLDSFKRSMSIHIPETVDSEIEGMLSSSGNSRESLKVAIHPGARKKTRQWDPQRFGMIARRLTKEHGARIILIGGPGEDELVDEVEREMGSKACIKSTELSLLQMAALLRRCSLFIGNDTAPGHIAGAVGCATLTLFGPNFPHLWRPLSPMGEVLFKNLPCCGCRHEEELCIRPGNSCMELITVEEVWEKVSTMLSRLQAARDRTTI